MTADDSIPWYDRGLVGKVVKGVSILVLGGSIAWAGGMLMAAADAKSMAKQNRKKIKSVKTEQKDIKDKLLPAIERLRQQTKSLEKSVNKLDDRQFKEATQ